MLAAGAVIASLLAKPVFHAGHPHGFWQVADTVIGLLGCAGVLLFAVLLLRPYSLGFSVKSGATYRALWDQGILEQPMVVVRRASEGQSFRETSNPHEWIIDCAAPLELVWLEDLLIEVLRWDGLAWVSVAKWDGYEMEVY